MPIQNDFSIKSNTTYKGTSSSLILTGNGLDSVQVSILDSVESLIRNSGPSVFSDYKLSAIDAVALTNSRLFYDADSTVAQTTLPSEAVLLAFLLQDGVYDTASGSGPVTDTELTAFITGLVSKIFPFFSKAYGYLNMPEVPVVCGGTDLTGRYESSFDKCTYKLQVVVY